MSVIFQLFRADDLKMLSRDQLDELKKKINAALKEAQQEFQSHAGSSEGPSQQKSPSEETPPEPLRLNISHKPDPSPHTPPQLKSVLGRALDKRFHEVSQQLKSTQLRSASDFDARLSRVHLNQPDSEEQEKEKIILGWAMSCEVNNFEFYYPLWRARKEAHDFFYQETGQVPKDPDSPYSPFNPGHPFSNFFYGLP
jgi:hypothetical protein